MGCLQDSIEGMRSWLPSDTWAIMQRERGSDSRLDDFSIAYIECAFWSSMTNTDDQGGEPLDEAHDASDLAPETLETMLRDCDRFLATDAVKAALRILRADYWTTISAMAKDIVERVKSGDVERDEVSDAAQLAYCAVRRDLESQVQAELDDLPEEDEAETQEGVDLENGQGSDGRGMSLLGPSRSAPSA